MCSFLYLLVFIERKCIGLVVYESGDFMDETKAVFVTSENINIIKEYLNRGYFFDYDSAEECARFRRINYANHFSRL